MKPNHSKRRRRFGAIALAAMVTIQTGCVASRTFRDVAGPALESGITEIVNGLLDGFFAVIEPQSETL